MRLKAKSYQILLWTPLLILMAGAMPAARASPALAENRKCTPCHTMDKKLVGPSYKEIAARYAGQKDAESKLVAKIRSGGAGVWGPVPMPPNIAITQEDAQTLARWILGLQ